MIRLAAARRLMVTAYEIEQSAIDELIPVVFNAHYITNNMTQREKVDLRLPFPYKDVWYTSLHGNALYVSVNADTHGLWCCAFDCLYGVRGLPHEDIAMKAFVQPIMFAMYKGNPKRAILEAFNKVQPRIVKWYGQQSQLPWRTYEYDFESVS